MTAAEVAELLGVPVSTVREWGRNGILPRIKLGRHVRFIRSQVEEAILSHPAVRDCAVVGVPHETLGEVPVAFVVWLEQPVAADLMLEHCRSLLAAYKIPAELRSVEEIPRTGSGKVVRFRLREAYVVENSPEGEPGRRG